MIKVDLFSNFSLSVRLVFLMISLLVVNILLSAYRWYLIVSSMLGPVRFKSILLSTYTGLAYNNFLPGNVSGDVVRAHYLYRAVPEKAGLAVSTVLYDRVMGLLGLCLLFVCQALFYYHQNVSSRIILLPIMLASSAFIAIILPRQYSALLFSQIAISMKKHMTIKWVNRLAFIKSISFSRAVFVKALLISIIIQLVVAATLFCSFSFFDITSANYLQTLFASSITQLVSLIPITPGGLGLSEASFGHVMLTVSSSRFIAFSTVYLSYRFFNLIMTSPGLMLTIIGNHQSFQLTTPFETPVESK